MVEKKTRVLEDPAAVSRYDAIKRLGRDIFRGSDIEAGKITEDHILLAKNLLAEAAFEANPAVLAPYWEHILIAPKIGRRVAEDIKAKGIEVDPKKVEFVLWLHEIGRVVTDRVYMRNDRIANRIMREIGIPAGVYQSLTSSEKLMATAEKMGLTPGQYSWREPLTMQQELMAEAYFNSQTTEQRLTNLADNLGKRTPAGQLFDLAVFIDYLKSQESRYVQQSDWPSVAWAIARRPQGAFLQGTTVERTAKWLKDLGVDYRKISEDLADSGAKFLVVVRHGELDNIANIVYNRDALMDPQDIIHLSVIGRQQMRDLAEVLRHRQFNVSKIRVSPEIRTQESAQELRGRVNSELKTTIDPDLDEVYAPGPYQLRMTMDQLAEIGGNIYEGEFWREFDHETPPHIHERMKRSFLAQAQTLRIGEAGLLISHGDSIAWLVNHLVRGVGLVRSEMPVPANLREAVYLKAGEGMVFVLDSNNRIFTAYILNPIQSGHRY